MNVYRNLDKACLDEWNVFIPFYFFMLRNFVNLWKKNFNFISKTEFHSELLNRIPNEKNGQYEKKELKKKPPTH